MNIKNISKLLISSILFSSCNISSFASTFSEDGRYETFKDSNITINDVLEEDKVDIEINGNTLVNLKYKSRYQIKASGDNTHNLDITEDVNYIKATTNGQDYSSPNWVYLDLGTLNLGMLKPNTTYTVVGDILKGIQKITIDKGDCTKNLTTASDVVNNMSVIRTNDLSKGIDNQILYGLIRHDGEIGPIDIEAKNVMILEGDWTNKKLPNYFEEMKSVGDLDNNKFELSYYNNTENLIDNSLKEEGLYYRYDTGEIKNTVDFNSFGFYSEQNTTYKQSIERNNITFWKDNVFLGGIANTTTFTTPKDCNIVKISVIKTNNNPKVFKIKKKDIAINESLKGLPNGARDRIIRKNGQWFIERNVSSMTINGQTAINKNSGQPSDTNYSSAYFYLKDKRLYSDNTQSETMFLSDKLICRERDGFNLNQYNLNYNFITETRDPVDGVFIVMSKNDIPIDSSMDTSQHGVAYRQYFRDNPVELLYQLANPKYEPIKVDLSIDLNTDTTYLSTSSTIPANIKVVVDRALNKAVEAIEVAKLNPTRHNISQARMWTNLAKESIKKDDLQDELDSIKQVDDLTLEKKKVTSNVDVYIKSNNALSMSLNTNQVTFDSYSGVEEIEKLKAVGITISSSLPYDLNAYMPTPITSVDGSKTMDMSLFNIKESSDSNYKKFTNNIDKIALKTDCSATNNKIHNIDLKLDANRSHQPDIYKTVVKFEAEQK